MTTEPTGHLPECPQEDKWYPTCICDRLRAREARVREGVWYSDDEVGIIKGQLAMAWRRDGDRRVAAALDAARDAVAALPGAFGNPAYLYSDEVLAAIDAQRGES